MLRQAGHRCTVYERPPALLADLRRQTFDLLYIAREALSNSVRHGAPSKVAIDLRQSEDATILTVQDNGVGFDLATVRRGLGRVTMQTRADRLGATLTLIGIPGTAGRPRRNTPATAG